MRAWIGWGMAAVFPIACGQTTVDPLAGGEGAAGGVVSVPTTGGRPVERPTGGQAGRSPTGGAPVATGGATGAREPGGTGGVLTTTGGAGGVLTTTGGAGGVLTTGGAGGVLTTTGGAGGVLTTGGAGGVLAEGGRAGAQATGGSAGTDGACVYGTRQSCYTGPASTVNVGACMAGRRRCVQTPEGTQWTLCLGEVVPRVDLPGDEVDSDCDGTVDEPCQPGEVAPCPAVNPGLRACTVGTATCLDAEGRWSACEGDDVRWNYEQSIEDGVDDDCDGFVDERSSYAATVVFDGEAYRVFHQDDGGTAYLSTFSTRGQMLVFPQALPETHSYAAGTSVATWNPEARELAVAYGQGAAFLRLDHGGERVQSEYLTGNGCGPSRLEWTGEQYVTVFATSVSSVAQLFVSDANGAAEYRDLEWLEAGHCRETLQTTAESSDVLGVVEQIPSSPNAVSRPQLRLWRMNLAGEPLSGPQELYRSDESLLRGLNPAIVWTGTHYVVMWSELDVATLAVVTPAGVVQQSSTLPFEFNNPPRLHLRDGVVRGTTWTADGLVFFWWDGESPARHEIVDDCVGSCNVWTTQMALGPPGEHALVYHASDDQGESEVFLVIVDDRGGILVPPRQVSLP